LDKQETKRKEKSVKRKDRDHFTPHTSLFPSSSLFSIAMNDNKAMKEEAKRKEFR
jgi:hypothetical protein